MIDERRRTSFDAVAEEYHAARPTYPAETIDEVVRWSGVEPPGRVLEIGCGTGKATRPFAERGYRITCVEPGAKLAALVRRELGGLGVEVREATFEAAALDPGAFDLIFAGQSFHWVDPAVGYARAAELLRPQGTLALFWNQLDEQARADDDYFAANMAVYEREAPDLAREYREVRPRLEGIAERQAALREVFPEVALHRVRWSRRYSADEYLALIDTYSDHRVLPDARRERLYAGLRRLIEASFGGVVVKPYVTVLHLARTSQP